MRARPISWVPRGMHALGLIVLGLAYFLLAKFGLALASLHPSASPIWPPSGLALAAFLLWGNRVWPAVAAGAFLANITTFGTISSSLAIAVGNMLEALMTAWLLEKWSSRTDPFGTPSRVAIFAALALTPGTMISATVGVASLTSRSCSSRKYYQYLVDLVARRRRWSPSGYARDCALGEVQSQHA